MSSVITRWRDRRAAVWSRRPDTASFPRADARHRRSVRPWAAGWRGSWRAMLPDSDDLHRIGASSLADRLADGEHDQVARLHRSEERRVGKSVDLGGRRIIKKKKKNKQR